MPPITTLMRDSFLGKINEGTAHWVSQRATSAILIPLTVIFVFSFVKHLQLEYAQIIDLYTNPFRALLTWLFFSLTMLHFRPGAQVVIEDYIHDYKVNKFLLVINSLIFWVVNVCIFLALARILFLT
jgi:succinate dehydrogenase / fumarate reductase membrane anchor subunit